MKTVYAKTEAVERKWYVIDAADEVLGRVATRAATLLRGKHKPEFTRWQDLGDFVVIVNADKIRVTGRKPEDKQYVRHSGYPGGITAIPFRLMIQRKPTLPMEHAVRGMLPRNRLGRKQFTHLKVYAGSEHPHAAQKPEKVEV